MNHTEFTGGSQVSVEGFAAVDGASYGIDTTGMFVGFVDASVQGPGDAQVAYAYTGEQGSVTDAIVPFVAPAGHLAWTATLHGVAMANIVGVSLG